MKINYCDRIVCTVEEIYHTMMMMIMMGMRNARQQKWKKWTMRDRPNTVNIKPSSTMPSQAKPSHFQLNYMTKKEKHISFMIITHICITVISLFGVWPEHTLERENFLFLPFYRIESLIDHSLFNRFSSCCFLLLKSACSPIHKEAVAHKIQLPNEWRAKILLQIHRTSVGVSTLRVSSLSFSSDCYLLFFYKRTQWTEVEVKQYAGY